MHGAVGPQGHGLAGVAVVSAIATAQDPAASAKEIKDAVNYIQTATWPVPQSQTALAQKALHSDLKDIIKQIFEKTRSDGRVVQQITNTVVQNDSANATLALSCSPISKHPTLSS